MSSAGLSQTRTHNKANEIATLTGPSGVVGPVFDAVGNMTTMPQPGAWTTSNTVKWDAWNRVMEINQGGALVSSHVYDALARRASKTNGSETRAYYYDEQWRCVEERVSGNVKAQYTWSPLDRWTLIRRTRSVSGTLDEAFYCLKDYLDPAAIITTGAAVEERYSYDAFGVVRKLSAVFGSSSSTADWNFLFHAEFLDQDSGLYNYGFRFYHPNLGRWLSRDPIGENGGLNLFLFNLNAASAYVDDLGLEPMYPEPQPWNPKWSRERWEDWKNKGNSPPGHDPKHRPKDYPPGPLPEGTPAEPILWGEESPGEKGFPKEDEIEDKKSPDKPDCRCVKPTKQSSVMRPKGINGYPRPGLTGICRLGEVVAMKYPGRCMTKDHDNWDIDCGDCKGKTCNIYIVWECAAERYFPPGGGRKQPGWVEKQGMTFTKCK